MVAKPSCPPPLESKNQVQVVLETNVEDFGYCDEPGSPFEGVRRDMRVGCFRAGMFCTYLANPDYFEPWAAPKDEAKPAE